MFGSTGTLLQVTSQQDARLYVVMEVPSGKSPPCNEPGAAGSSRDATFLYGTIMCHGYYTYTKDVYLYIVLYIE